MLAEYLHTWQTLQIRQENPIIRASTTVREWWVPSATQGFHTFNSTMSAKCYVQVIHALKSRELILQLLEQWNQLRRETVQHARIKNTDLPHRYLVPKRFYDAMETHRHPERNSAVFIPKQELSHVLSPGGLTRRRSKVTELNPRKRSTVPDTTKCVTTDSRLDDSYPEDESYETNPKSSMMMMMMKSSLTQHKRRHVRSP